MKAELIKENLEGFHGDVKLYKLDKTLEYSEEWDDEVLSYDHIVISGVRMANVGGLPVNAQETYIFPANENGEVINWAELPGSFQGYVDHEEALNGFLNANNQ
jgi:hypothetical protein